MHYEERIRRVDNLVETATGSSTYDWAVPQDWANAVRDKTGIYPPSHVVWVYDAKASIFGRPFAIDMIGWICLKLAEEV